MKRNYQTVKLTINRFDPDAGRARPVAVELSIDVEQLADLLGHKAMRNTSRKSNFLGGCIKAKAQWKDESK